MNPAFLALEVPAGVRGVVAGSTICGLLALATITVYATGGTHLAYAHIAYVPIIVGAFFFGFRGGILTALAIGLLLGSFMPLNVEAGTYQSSINWLSRTGFFLLTGGLAGLLCAALRTQLELARRHAYYDRLTGLPNRLSCLRDLEAMIRSADLDNSQFSVLKLGLTRLDYFAATLGHRHADGLLKAAAERLSRKTDTSRSLYHVGGGVFAVVCRHTSTEEAIELGEALLAALNERFTVGGLPILASGQSGLACYPDHAEDAQGLLRAAAAGFRDTVEKGRSYSVYDEQRNTAHRSAIMLLPDLQAAIDGDD
ncbi:MAG TPA: GGDEF domain-containing protein [Afifellaceae bacterium]|nr:GGDEF domain-containing protein [Afifellaceae bacterium]